MRIPVFSSFCCYSEMMMAKWKSSLITVGTLYTFPSFFFCVSNPTASWLFRGPLKRRRKHILSSDTRDEKKGHQLYDIRSTLRGSVFVKLQEISFVGVPRYFKVKTSAEVWLKHPWCRLMNIVGSELNFSASFLALKIKFSRHCWDCFEAVIMFPQHHLQVAVTMRFDYLSQAFFLIFLTIKFKVAWVGRLGHLTFSLFFIKRKKLDWLLADSVVSRFFWTEFK